jgi:hypothetical protein
LLTCLSNILQLDWLWCCRPLLFDSTGMLVL